MKRACEADGTHLPKESYVVWSIDVLKPKCPGCLAQALMLRMGLRGILYYTYNKEP